jgi:hypothetical protein
MNTLEHVKEPLQPQLVITVENTLSYYCVAQGMQPACRVSLAGLHSLTT